MDQYRKVSIISNVLQVIVLIPCCCFSPNYCNCKSLATMVYSKCIIQYYLLLLLLNCSLLVKKNNLWLHVSDHIGRNSMTSNQSITIVFSENYRIRLHFLFTNNTMGSIILYLVFWKEDFFILLTHQATFASSVSLSIWEFQGNLQDNVLSCAFLADILTLLDSQGIQQYSDRKVSTKCFTLQEYLKQSGKENPSM